MGKVTLTAAVGGLCSATLYLSVLLGTFGAFVLGYLAPLPIFIVGLWVGDRAAVMAGATAAGVIGLLTGNGAMAAVFLVTVTIPVALVVRQALLSRIGGDGQREWYPPGPLLMSLVLYGVAGLLGAAGFSLLEGVELEERVVALLRAGLAPVLATAPEGVVGNGDFDALITALAMVFPAMAVGSWLVMLVVNGALAQGLLKRWGRNRRPGPAMTALELPVWMTGALVLALPAALIPEGTAGMLARNGLLILLLPFFFLGLAVLHRLAGRWSGRTALLVVMYLFILIFGWPVVLVIGLGLIEHGLGLRRRVSAARPDEED